jgi:hypothetical protein
VGNPVDIFLSTLSRGENRACASHAQLLIIRELDEYGSARAGLCSRLAKSLRTALRIEPSLLGTIFHLVARIAKELLE